MAYIQKGWFLALSVIALAVMLCGCGNKPDLLVSQFTYAVPTANVAEGLYEIPATIVRVKNEGGACDSGFIVHLGCYIDPDVQPYYYFTVPGKFEKKYQWQCKALSSDEEETWIGTMYVAPEPSITEIGFSIYADLFDVVDEAKEDNNAKGIKVKLPPWPAAPQEADSPE
jgi:hypothetical protein